MYRYGTNKPPSGVAAALLSAALTALVLIAPAGAREQTNAELGFPIGAQRYAMDEEESKVAIKEEFGVEIQPLRVTAAGNMLDFRYRVLDAEKAAALHRPQIRPYLMDPDSKARLRVPKTKVGTFRQGKNIAPQKDRVYTTLFANPGRRLGPGEEITVVFGDMVLEGMRIQ